MELAAASSVAGLIQLTEIFLKNGYEFVRHAKDADRFITSLLAELTGLAATLKTAMEVMGMSKGDFKFSPQTDLDACEKTLKEILLRLHEHNPAQDGRIRSKVPHALRRISQKGYERVSALPLLDACEAEKLRWSLS